MSVKSAWAVVDSDLKNRIHFIEDICDKTGQMSITNDAENVIKYVQGVFGPKWRVVYKDTAGEWWEIKYEPDGMWDSDFRVTFKKWHGLAWDILQRAQ